MHAIYDLKEMLCKELEEYGKKGELSAGTLDIVDKLAHTIKNLDKIIETSEEDDYSNYGGNSYEMNRNRSYSRGRNRRYSSTGYSRNSDMVSQLRMLMNDAPDDRTRQKIQNLVSEMEMM